MFKYTPPADIDDLAGRPTRQTFLDQWHTFIAGRFAFEAVGRPHVFSEVNSPATSGNIPITWDAFPLSLRRIHPGNAAQRWTAAETLDTSEPEGPFRPQDEYCEWFVYRDTPAGPIKRIVFTAEAPEYWEELALADFDRVLALYREHVSPLVQPQDLIANGSYNPRNKWNTTDGVMHLTHAANTLAAEINLAARATVMRRKAAGQRITDLRPFACASNFGDVNRSSDPTIGQKVNHAVLPPAPGATSTSITLANPVALYIHSIKANVLTDENDAPLPTDWFQFVRGVAGRGLMCVLKPPPGATFGLDKVKVAGRALTHGGQVADHITMALYGKTTALGAPQPQLQAPVAHCCAAAATDLSALDKVNLDYIGANGNCGAGMKDPFAPPPGPVPMAAAPPAAIRLKRQRSSPYYKTERGGV